MSQNVQRRSIEQIDETSIVSHQWRKTIDRQVNEIEIENERLIEISDD